MEFCSTYFTLTYFHILTAWISAWDYDIMTIVETWLHEGHGWQLNVPGFRCFRCD